MELKKKTPIKPLDLEHTPLAFRFSTLAKKYYSAATKEFKDFDLERNFFVLSVIGSHEFITQQCLANSLDIDKASIVRIIDYLSEKGFVKREVNPNDRREHIVIATPKAKKLITQIKNTFILLNENTFKGFSPKEKNTFMELTQRMLENLCALPVEDEYRIKYIKKNNTK